MCKEHITLHMLDKCYRPFERTEGHWVSYMFAWFYSFSLVCVCVVHIKGNPEGKEQRSHKVCRYMHDLCFVLFRVQLWLERNGLVTVCVLELQTPKQKTLNLNENLKLIKSHWSECFLYWRFFSWLFFLGNYLKETFTVQPQQWTDCGRFSKPGKNLELRMSKRETRFGNLTQSYLCNNW